MGLFATNPVVVSRYCRIPSRRLISGFLTVNVVNAQAGTEKDDFNDWVYSNNAPSDVENPLPFGGGHNTRLTDPNRTGKKLSFGDYDCFIFWVVGGMVLHTPTNSGGFQTSGDLASNGYDDTTANTWKLASTLSHNCQSFVKYHLISRINNGYGHTAAAGGGSDGTGGTPDPPYGGTFGIERREYRTNGLPNYSNVTNLSNTTIINSTVTPTAGSNTATCSGLNGKFSEYVVSDGLWSTSNEGGEILSTDSENTFNAPVTDIQIYGKHYFNIPTQLSGSDDHPVVHLLSSGPTVDGVGYYHTTAFWDLVVDVKFMGFKDGTESSASVEDSDRQHYKTNTNIFFQPFGETGNFSWSDSQHTS
tara:strand:+ start:83 stop:1165 length:1083 start_codon:yes stop_codon:yes gene_type:complete